MTNSRRDHVYRTDALIVGRLDLGEVDRILTLFTPQHGKVRAIAKGVRRPQSRLAPHLELFSESRVMLAKGRELDVVTGAEMIDAHWPLRSDLEAFGHASYLVELLNLFLEDRQENRRAYELLSRSLHLLGEGIEPFAITRHYELALMELVGFRPQLYQCVGCEREIMAEPNAFSLNHGGLLCPHCRSIDLSAPVLSVNAQKYIRVLDRDGLAGAVKLRLEPQTANEVERVLAAYARHHAERESRSLGVLKSMREWRPPYDVGATAAVDQSSTK
jgi:DNA repair protein RecO (recombination protein O)